MKHCCLGITACLLLASACLAEDKPAPDPDLEVQGEYAGEIITDNSGKLKFGVQVIALGKGQFRAVAYGGGLPGAGWNREGKIEGTGKRENNAIVFMGEQAGPRAELANNKLNVYDENGKLLGAFEKTARVSDTIGKKPPEGAVVLFDGSNGDQFKEARVENELLREGVTSIPTFQDCKLHLEFMLSFMPEATGQGRSNSGVYLQGRYEVQILDSFGLEGMNNECGGLYSIKAPDLNMCFPPMVWQTYDIEYTAAKFDDAGKKTANARITVYHNGVLIHNKVELPKATTAAPVAEGPEPGPLYIQNHGNPIWFRNIWYTVK